MATLVFAAEGDARTGLGHLVRVTGVAGALAGRHEVHLASASPHRAAVVAELAPWATGPVVQHPLPPASAHPWTRGEALAASLTEIARAVRAAALVLDGRTAFAPGAFAGARPETRVIWVDSGAAAPEADDLVVLPTCHADPTAWPAQIAWRLRTGPDWTFVHPAVTAAAARPPQPRAGLFVSMGGSDPNGLTWPAVAHLLATRPEPVTAVVGPANAQRRALEALAADTPRLRLVCGSPAVQDALAGSAWALCAFGISAYEAVRLGVPVAVIQHEGGVGGDLDRFAAAFPGRVQRCASWREAVVDPTPVGGPVAALGGLAASLGREIEGWQTSLGG